MKSSSRGEARVRTTGSSGGTARPWQHGHAASTKPKMSLCGTWSEWSGKRTRGCCRASGMRAFAQGLPWAPSLRKLSPCGAEAGLPKTMHGRRPYRVRMRACVEQHRSVTARTVFSSWSPRCGSQLRRLLSRVRWRWERIKGGSISRIKGGSISRIKGGSISRIKGGPDATGTTRSRDYTCDR
jgi:hypothetical protein